MIIINISPTIIVSPFLVDFLDSLNREFFISGWPRQFYFIFLVQQVFIAVIKLVFIFLLVFFIIELIFINFLFPVVTIFIFLAFHVRFFKGFLIRLFFVFHVIIILEVISLLIEIITTKDFLTLASLNHVRGFGFN